MEVSSLREAELRHYWRAMQEIGKVFPEFDSREELALLSDMSEWPRLREAAAKNIGRFDFYSRRIAITR